MGVEAGVPGQRYVSRTGSAKNRRQSCEQSQVCDEAKALRAWLASAANYWIRNSSRFLPDARSIANHRGILPRPDQVSEGLSGILKFRLDLGVGPSLRDVFRRPAEPATKLIKLVLKLAFLAFQFPVKDLYDPLVKIPEVIKPHPI